MRRKEKQVTVRCAEVQEIQSFFENLSKRVTSGCNKVWMSEESNGTVNFLIGKEKISVSMPGMKGGML